jgi:hypothetical protein
MVWFGPVGLGLLYAGLVEWRAGSHVARLYLAARLALVVGTSANIFRQVGWVSTNAWTSNAQQAGSLVEFVLLSLALADLSARDALACVQRLAIIYDILSPAPAPKD